MKRKRLVEAFYTQDGEPIRLRLYDCDEGFLLTVDDVEHVVRTAADIRAALPVFALEVPGREGYERARFLVFEAFKDFWNNVPLVPDRGGPMTDDEEEAILTRLVDETRRGET